jgi:3-oxoacyl-ACP reductase-like protein
MSIFSKIKSAIFGEKGPLGSGHFGTPKPDAPAAAPQTTAAQPQAAPAPHAAPAATPVTAPAPQSVDVEAVLSGIASRKNSDLNWRSSIVDLMKLLDLDSSLDNRKELATELGYTGAKDGSAEMNIWLHKAVMRELEKNGGTVPAGLKD